MDVSHTTYSDSTTSDTVRSTARFWCALVSVLYIQIVCSAFFFFQAEDGIRDHCVTGVQTCALPIF